MEKIGNILYTTIREIGKEKIQSDITSDIGLSRQYIEMIMTQCDKRIKNTSNKTIGSLCEALLHFMLTSCTLPSMRKVNIEGVYLDIVIPNLHTLRKYPDKAIVVQISKDMNNIMKEQLKNVIKIQPNIRNLWVVSRTPFLTGHINYIVEPGKNIPSLQKRNFHDIILDINKFLELAGDRSFRFFQ
jgi:hypothetical protein